MLKIFTKKLSAKVKSSPAKGNASKTWFESFVTLFWNLVVQPLRMFGPILWFAVGAIKVGLLLVGFVFSVVAIAGTILFQSIFKGDISPGALSKGIEDATVLEVVVNDALMGAAMPDLQEALVSGERFTFVSALEGLRRAVEDPRIKGAYVKIDDGVLGVAECQELRKALARFKKAKKWVVTYADKFAFGGSASTFHYYLASISDEIWMHHFGEFAPTGLMMQVPRVREALTKIKVTPHFIAKKEYKNYPEMFTHNALSPEAREVMKDHVDGLSRQLVMGISQGRSLSFVEANRILEEVPLTDRDALKSGYIDKLLYHDEIRPLIKERYKIQNILSVKEYTRLMDVPNDLSDVKKTVTNVTTEKKKIIVVALHGQISLGSSDSSQASDLTPRYVQQALKQARKKKPDAVILHIDSPGGDPLASEMIHRQIAAFAKDIPVVALLGNVAGSGGYWIATAAKHIVALPGTLTGSIGVLMGKFELTDLWDYLGVRWGTVKSHEGAGAFASTEGFAPQTLEKIDTIAEDLYARFVDRVATSRNLEHNYVETIAKGRVWLGSTARKNKLIDSTGGYVAALKKCAALMKVETTDVQVGFVSRPLSFPLLVRNMIGVYMRPWISGSNTATLMMKDVPVFP
ncbi:MAG: S49 family peptidase [Alphaproteobacteria bacterium]|nr:MAG: S49 family peptidase [Alphaproteobacteria bacterium]